MSAASPDDPRSRLDRSNPEVAREFCERCFPDPDIRKKLLTILAGSIEAAHRISHSVWSVTLALDKSYVSLNVGRIFVFSLQQGDLSITLIPPEKDLGQGIPALKWRGDLEVVPGARWYRIAPDDLLKHWDDLREPHLKAVREAAEKAHRTPYYGSHSPAVVAYAEQELDRELPRPDHRGGETELDQFVDQVVSALAERYPGWSTFAHPEFLADEVTYKREAAALTEELLAEDELHALIDSQDFDEIESRLKKVANKTNLLYLGTPKTSDLAVLHSESLDWKSFSQALFDLLYGSGESDERLNRFSTYLDRNTLPNKWSLPTYLLFLRFPDSDYFVKPRVTKWFLQRLEAPGVYHHRPTGARYSRILALVQDLLAALEPYGARDLLDVQSAIWVAHSVAAGRSVEPPPEGEEYPLEECADDLGMDLGDVQRWVRAIERKGQAILYGPPGTGKTYVALHLARHLVGGGDGFQDLVQFHPSYAYEDFIQGIRPEAREDGGLHYPVRPGRFLDFCRKAREREGRCVMIVDEINRANLSRVFGELMYLLEYRDKSVPLAAGEELTVPENVCILGTMNTADRSIALVDHALRRRFAFLHLGPDYEVLRRFHEGDDFDVEPLIEVLQEVNEAINDPHYEVGITFFLVPDLQSHLEDIWRMEILPYLEEYFFDRPDSVEQLRWQPVKARIGM